MVNAYEEEHPETHLTFAGTKIQVLTDKGDASIVYYGLDRKELDEPRLEVYNDINVFVDALTIVHGIVAETQMLDKLKERIKDKIDIGQHTLMIKCNF